MNRILIEKMCYSPIRLPQNLYGSKLDWVIIKEIQRIPELLNLFHQNSQQNTNQDLRFFLTCSSAHQTIFRSLNVYKGFLC